MNVKVKYIGIIALLTLLSICLFILLFKYSPVKNEGRLSFYRNSQLIKNIYIQSVETTEFRTEQHLMYDSMMPESCGMLFIYKDESVMPFRMNKQHQPFDVLFIAPNNSIVIMEKNVPSTSDQTPSSQSGVVYKWILILNAGFCDTYSIMQNDSVSFKLTNKNPT
jgi:uncharacterized membrane protein (UPF0127 family)